MKKPFYFLVKMKFVFFTVAVGEAREINTELLELSGLPEKPG
jgi:hypothetical protein